MSNFRGVVISPGFKSTGPVSFSASTTGINELLHQCLLYWDKIEWPTNNLVHVGGGPDIDFLISAGALQRTKVQMAGAFGGDLTPVFAQAQLKIFDHLESSQPGAWSISQASDALSFPGQNVAKLRALECQLFQVLPVPAETVAFQDILEFRTRYSAELQSLRKAMDEFYEHIIQSPDPSRARARVIADLVKATDDVEKALDGVSLHRRRADLVVEIKPTDALEQAIRGAGFAKYFGIPISLGAAVGAVLSTIGFKPTDVPTPARVRTGPFAYLYHAKRELGP
jgi:hypothetical protein